MHVFPLILAAAFLAQNLSPSAELRAHHADTAPTIDGRLDEPAWKAADVGSNFRQLEPTEGAPATERTEIRVLYDNATLYVGVRLYDGEPGKIVRRLSRRDDDPDADKFTFYVDALHDRITGAAFEVSAAGSQRDAIICSNSSR